MSEREIQQRLADDRGDGKVWLFDCEDGDGFSAVASTESGAFRVLNAERPWIRSTFGVQVPMTAKTWRY